MNKIYPIKVELLTCTPDALNLLLKTKNTRLTTDDNPELWDDEKRIEHLEYMRDTIKSSWEFVDYTFQIDIVTRAFTHQLVRTRTGSYAQQAMRVVDAREFGTTCPPSVEANEAAKAVWEDAITELFSKYGQIVDLGVPIQDARGILPTNVQTRIMAKFNLRTLHEMAKLRLCTRTQGEYQDVFRSMRELVIEVHPWAKEFLEVYCVANGTCAFPRYGVKECPVYFPELDNTDVKEKAKELFWSIRYEAAPVAKNGMAM